ncbi:MAG TPA: four-helix bundle copper-binding protein [Sporichthyaceae bacterium]
MTTVSHSKVSTLHLDLPAPAREALQRALECCLTCVETCTACADACLREDDLDALRACILSDLDCADICDTTARVLARSGGAQVGVTRAMLNACIAACHVCREECARHAAHHAHCKACDIACQSCEDACRDLLAQLD